MIISLLSLISAAIIAGSAWADCPEGDLNRDCIVDFLDLAVLAESWLDVEPDLPTGTVVINEVMTHSHGTAPDWIELYNTSGSAIDISGWYLSDSDRRLTGEYAYQIPNGTIIPAYGYIVCYENQFGAKFKLSENGDNVYLSIPRDGKNFGMDDRTFDASEMSVSFGRYTTSTGDVKFVAMDSNTPGTANAYPKVGPVVINEVMYYWDTGNPDNDYHEYIELYNIEDYAVNLWTYDPCTSTDLSWEVTKGISYTFPYHTTIPAHGYLIVAKTTTPAEFRSFYPRTPTDVNIFCSFGGKLSNEGEDVQLSFPGELPDPCDLNSRVYVRVDNVNYSDGEHHENFPGLDPWVYTNSANGGGDSLQRIYPSLYGDDVNNWKSASASPGEPTE
jgi:hypothetical protein